MKIRLIILVTMLILISQFATAQEITNEVTQDYQTRTAFSLRVKPYKNFKLYISPEMRFSESFSVDKAFLETELVYNPIKYLYFGGNYRFVINPREVNDTEYLHRFGLSTSFKKDFKRFTPTVKFAYTNYADDNTYDNFFRYKAGLKYNIPNCKLTPSIGVQAFHQLSENEIYKMRYKLGLDYKLFKNNYLGVSYKLDYYMQEYTNKHIFCLTYKIKL